MRLHPEKFRTSHYIARQSWISAFSRPVSMPADMRFKSKFLQRSIEGDFKSDALKRISNHAANSDVLLIDLATDRRGYLPIGGTAATISFSREVETSTATQDLPARPKVDFGTDQHFARFTRTALKMKKRLNEIGIFDRTLILRLPFVDESTGGELVPVIQQKTGQEWNSLFIPYYQILEEIGFHLTPPLPDEFAIADSEHLWGLGPDHYIAEAYAWWAEQIMHFDEERPGIQPMPAQFE